MPSTKRTLSISSPRRSTEVIGTNASILRGRCNNIVSALTLEKAPYTRLVRWRCMANVDSMVLAVRMCSQCSPGNSTDSEVVIFPRSRFTVSQRPLGVPRASRI